MKQRLARMGPRSFRGQIVTSTVVLMTAVMVAVGIGIQFVLGYTAQRDIDKVLGDRSAAAISVLQADEEQPDASLGAELEPGIQVYDDRGRLVAGTVAPQARAAAGDLARRLAGTTETRQVDASEELRLRGEPVTTETGWRGIVVVSQPTTPYERSELYALLATVIAGLAVVAVSGWMADLVTSQALRPVTQMAERATDWSEHDLGHRFGLDPDGNELDRLGATLDGLLDRVAGALRAEQRLTSELAHELRTPLTAIQGVAELGELRGSSDPRAAEDYHRIAESARTMTETIQTLLDVARHRLDADAQVGVPLAQVVPDLELALPGGTGLICDLGDVTLAIPRSMVARALVPLVENAARYADSEVHVRARDTGRRIVVTVADDGPGISRDLESRLFDPGISGSGGTGLGLAVARRVVQGLGGSVRLAEAHGSAGGAVFEVEFPRT